MKIESKNPPSRRKKATRSTFRDHIEGFFFIISFFCSFESFVGKLISNTPAAWKALIHYRTLKYHLFSPYYGVETRDGVSSFLMLS